MNLVGLLMVLASPSRFDIGSAVEQLVQRYRGSGIRVDYEESPVPFIEECYFRRITYEILPHLFQNAREGMLPQGAITCRVYSDDSFQTIEVTNPIGRRLSHMPAMTTKGPGRGKGLFYANLYTKSLGGKLHTSVSAGKFVAQVKLPRDIIENPEVLEYIAYLP